MINNNELITNKALEFAREKHKGQIRKNNKYLNKMALWIKMKKYLQLMDYHTILRKN